MASLLIGKERKTARSRMRPLNMAAAAAFYYVQKQDPFEVTVGFSSPYTWPGWKKLMISHHEGFQRTITEKQREFFVHKGIEMKKSGKKSSNRKSIFYLLRKSTTTFTTPARPIVTPFWEKYHGEAWENIRSNYIRKMRGERI
jgi:hypothetical protein